VDPQPRDSALPEICGEHGREVPSHEVLYLDVRPQQDPVPLSAQAPAELDVLDLGSGIVPLVKHPDLEEGRAANRTTARPECLGLPRPLLVHVVMQQVAILRNDPGCWRSGIVRAERRTERWLRGKEVRETVQGVVVHPHVCVEEDEYVAPTNFGSSVSSVRGPVWLAGEANHRVGMWR